jgi:hypothetical protein
VLYADRTDASDDTDPKRSQIEEPAPPPGPEPTPAVSRGTRPAIPPKESILHFQQWELTSLIQWIESDGRLRTDDELIANLIRELGFQKRGTRIEAACRGALRQVRAG